MRKIFFSLTLTFLLSLCAFAQAVPQPSPTPPVEEDSDVVKISTALIQLDVVVTDKNGNLVTDLKPEDFEIMENGEPQAVTNLSYFSGQKNSLTNGDINSNFNTNQAMPTVNQVRRTVAIVIDDAGMSVPSSVVLVKKELTKFVNEQLQPNDLVAIIKTSGTVGILQQFTTDKKKMLEIIENVKYQPLTAVGLNPFAPIGLSFAEQIQGNTGNGDGLSALARSAFEQKSDLEFFANVNKSILVTRGSLGVLSSTINVMDSLPGRKSVLYVAEGVNTLIDQSTRNNLNNSSFGNSGGGKGGGSGNGSVGDSTSIFRDSRELEGQLRGITEIANRATIAVYTLDPRGTATVSFTASDRMLGGIDDRQSGGINNANLNAAANNLRASQLGLKFLSSETGGKAFINSNDLGKSLRETLDSQNGYYILAYQPNTDTFDANKRRFNKINIKVKRPNLNVVYRSGFFNIAEKAEEKPAPERIFMEKLFSPYRSSDIDLKATSIFAADEQATTVRSFVRIKPEDLQFIAGANGDTKTALFDIVAIAFSPDGIPVSQVAKRFEIKVTPKEYETLLAKEIAYNLTFATRTKGAQQIKIAVRDANTNRIGTTSQTINVPDFDKNKFAFSGLLLQNFTQQEWQNIQGGKAPADAASRMQSDTARRQFKKGTVLSFNYAAYAAPSFRSKSQAQFTVFKDGKEVFKGAPNELNFVAGDKIQRVNNGGAFLLGTDMEAGRYVLQVVISGDALKEPEIQRVDFDLVN